MSGVNGSGTFRGRVFRMFIGIALIGIGVGC